MSGPMYETPQNKPVSRTAQPCVLELLGPAGAGKSTLRHLLGQCSDGVYTGDRRPMLERAYRGSISTVRLLPTFLGTCQSGNIPSRQVMERMVRLQAVDCLLDRRMSAKYRAIVLDEGPIFLLTWLDAFGLNEGRSQVLNQWIDSVTARWSTRLSLLVWLDAPDSVLAHRIRTRAKPHRMKNEADEVIAGFLSCYRLTYEKVLSRLTRAGGPPLLRFNTAREPLKDIATRVLAAMSQE